MQSDVIVQEAVKYLRCPAVRYRHKDQGQDPSGFDCSGYCGFVIRRVGFPLPEWIRHCNEFFDYFGVYVHHGLQRKGDLVFFSWKGAFPNHMGIMISDDAYIHSPGRDGSRIRISKLVLRNIPHRSDSSVTRLYSYNPIGFKRPSISEGRFHRI